jgi:dihydroflavonol-4-reductase
MPCSTALVTGANGFVGCHVVRELLKTGVVVRALVRKDADLRALAGFDCQRVVGDLRDASAIVEFAHGCDTIYHIAADYRLWVPDPAPMYAANVEGTRNLLEAGRRAKVKRIVHTSTVGALGIVSGGSGREDTPVRLEDMVGPYKRSKFLAEQLAVTAAREGLPVVIVNPSTPIGPLDYKPTPTGRIITDFLNRRMPAYVDTGLNLAPVEDIASGHLLAAERGLIGEKYILGGENLTLAEMLNRLAQLSGLDAPRFRLPYGVALAFACGAEAVARVTLRPPRASVTEVRMARKRMFFDDAKARRELGYNPGSVDEALRRAIAFFRGHNYVLSGNAA